MSDDDVGRLTFLLAEFCSAAELVGSRGRARFYGRDPHALPNNTDYDYAIFTDDQARFDKFHAILTELVERFDFVPRSRPAGTTVSAGSVDLNIYPVSKREEIHQAWKLMEGGLTKEEAWRTVNANQQTNPSL